MLDCLLIVVPKVSIMRPLVGAPLLKAYLLQNGFTAKVVDYNIKLYNDLAKVNDEAHVIWSPRVYKVQESKTSWPSNAPDDKVTVTPPGGRVGAVERAVGPGNAELFVNQLYYESFYEDTLKPYIQQYAKDCVDENARWIGISLLSIDSVWITGSFIKEIKEINPDQKIVIGGPGASNYKEKSHLVQPDQIILGEGDEPIVSLLKGEPIFDQYYHLSNLKDVPYPDYSDLDFNEYVGQGTISRGHFPELRITGSRGCVRNCTFCNVNSLWPKFKYRPGKDIAGEMIHLNQKYGVVSFDFTDSLVNGSIRALNDMCKEIKQARKGKDVAWTWQGNAICRSAKQMPEEVWANMKDAGVNFWRIGVESGSDSVREHMGKKSSIEDVHHTFNIAAKYNIPIAFNMMVGYPTETEEDFQDSVSLLRYIAELNKTIPDHFKHVLAGIFSCLIFDGAPLTEMNEVIWATNEYVPSAHASRTNFSIPASAAKAITHAAPAGLGSAEHLRTHQAQVHQGGKRLPSGTFKKAAKPNHVLRSRNNEQNILTNLHWEIKDHPEGLPYNAKIRLDRMASLTNLGTDLGLIISNELADERKMPRYYANW